HAIALEQVHGLQDKVVFDFLVGGDDDRLIPLDLLLGCDVCRQFVPVYFEWPAGNVVVDHRNPASDIDLDLDRLRRRIVDPAYRRERDDARGDHGCGHHENHQQHQHHVDIGNDVDLA